MELKGKIDEIEHILSENKREFKGIGVSTGISGLSLFYYYCFKYSNDPKYLNQAIHLLEDGIEMLNENYKSSQTKIDIVEFGLYILFLINNDVLEVEDDFLQGLDEIIMEITQEQIKKKSLHNFSGALLGGTYFVKRGSIERTKDILITILDLIEQKSILKNDHETYWISDFREGNKVELNLNHGIGGIVSFLLKLYNRNIEKERCSRVITCGVNFILNQKKTNKDTLFPLFASEDYFFNYSNLCYGDISIGYVIVKAGESLNDSYMLEQGLEVLKDCAERRESYQHLIQEASLIYGSAGLSSFFYRMYKNYNINSFKEADAYWQSKTEKFSESGSKWAGYSVFFKTNQEVATHLSFSHGIAGIGISLLSKDIKDDLQAFLGFLKYDI